MSDFISAVNAYQKILAANRGIKPSQPSNINEASFVLRKADDLVRVGSGAKVDAQDSFPKALEDAYIRKPIQKVRSYSEGVLRPTKTDATDAATNVIELMENMDKLHTTVSSIVAVRDKLLSAYMEIMKMPI
jgi:flagellar hook-basal body complex protein FliE